jgi:hypothetical protein
VDDVDARKVWYVVLESILTLACWCLNITTATEMPSILPPYHRSLQDYEDMIERLRPHSVTFEEARAVMARWVAQEWLEEDGWEAKWEDLCDAEVDGWD